VLHGYADTAVFFRIDSDTSESSVPIYLNLVSLSCPDVVLDQALTAIFGFNRQTAPEFEATVYMISLTIEGELEANAVLCEPLDGRVRLVNQDLAEFSIRSTHADAPHVSSKISLGVRVEIDILCKGVVNIIDNGKQVR
jgi:hypothetical protein